MRDIDRIDKILSLIGEEWKKSSRFAVRSTFL